MECQGENKDYDEDGWDASTYVQQRYGEDRPPIIYTTVENPIPEFWGNHESNEAASEEIQMQEAEINDYLLGYQYINLDAIDLALPFAVVIEYLIVLSPTLELLE